VGPVRIGSFVTCLADTLFPDTGKAVVAVLERLGHQVDFPTAAANAIVARLVRVSMIAKTS
jgi:Fe-S oxidoreductase